MQLLAAPIACAAALSCLDTVAAGPRQPGLSTYQQMNEQLGRLTANIVLSDADQVADRWFAQKLDHTDPLSTRTYQQRWQVSTKYAKPGRPAFILMGGEGAITSWWLTARTHIMLLAQTYGATVFQLEHRYYGQSQPFDSFSTENLRYLSSQQALRDAIAFVDWASGEAEFGLSNSTQWYAFGGSYPGMLAAWMRTQFPHKINGAFASSAPVHAKVDMDTYVGHAYGYVLPIKVPNGKQCVEAIRKGMLEVKQKWETPAGRQDIAAAFNLCAPLGTYAENWEKANIASQFYYIFDLQGDTPAFGSKIPAKCNALLATNGTAMERIAKWALATSGNTGCLDINPTLVWLDNLSVYEDAWVRQWTWQYRTEFGFLQTGTHPSTPLNGWGTADDFAEQCQYAFGAGNDVTSHPWSTLGVTKTEANSGQLSLMFANNSHCQDMWGPTWLKRPSDTVHFTTMNRTLGEWIKSDSRRTCRSTVSHITDAWCVSVGGCDVKVYSSFCKWV